MNTLLCIVKTFYCKLFIGIALLALLIVEQHCSQDDLPIKLLKTLTTSPKTVTSDVGVRQVTFLDRISETEKTNHN